MKSLWKEALVAAAWHEKRDYDGWTNLSSNETRHPELFTIWGRAWTAADFRTLNRYPHWPSARRHLARLRNCSEDTLAVFAGSDAALRHIANSIEPSSTMILAVPNYPVLKGYLAAVGHTTLDVAVGYDFGRRDAASLLQTIGLTARPVVWVADPCPHSGACFTMEQVVRLARTVEEREGLLVWDGAYADFAEMPTATAARAAGALVLRTLSKGYGCAGVRLASVEGAPPAINALQRTYGANDLSTVACEAARLCVEHSAAFDRIRADVVQWREEFRLLMGGSHPSIIVHPSQGNFVLLSMHAEAALEFIRRLNDRRILPKLIELDGASSRRLIRLTVPEPNLRATVLEASLG